MRSTLGLIEIAVIGLVLLFTAISIPEVSIAQDLHELIPARQAVLRPLPSHLVPTLETSLSVGDPEAGSFEVKEFYFRVNPSECIIYPGQDGYDYLAIGTLTPNAGPGRPVLPMKTFSFEVSKYSEVIRVEALDIKIEEVANALSILPGTHVDPPHKWDPVPNPQIYGLLEPFPGRLVALDQGADSKALRVFVRFFPVQYIPSEKKAYVITEAAIRVTFRQDSEARRPFNLRTSDFDGELITDATCLLLCSPGFESAAQNLASFHRESHKIQTLVVSTESLASSYEQAEDPEQPGYRDRLLPGFDHIQNYDYALAKKIIAFLLDEEAHHQLQSVILLGDALLVPPSYYYYFSEEVEQNRWIPSDFFFSSPDYDWVPNFKVGRLPVNDLNEANRLVDKIIRWQRKASWDWFKNVYACGFVNHFSLEAKREGLFKGMVYESFLAQDGRFNKEYLVPAFSGRGVGIFYHVFHGSGDGMILDHSAITAGELMGLPPSDQIPIVISIACDNGSSDRDLVGPRPFDRRDREDLSLPTFGEAVLKSRAGGIAYFGGTRRDAGGHNWYYIDGQPVPVKQYYMAALVGFPLFRAYRDGTDTLGGLYLESISSYLMENDLGGDDRHWVPLLEFTLLGDPELRFPSPR